MPLRAPCSSSVSHSHDHTFVQPLQEPSPPNLRPWLNACPLWPEANVDTMRQHRPSRALCPVPIRSTLPSTHRCVKQVSPIVMLQSRHRSLANSGHGESSTTRQCDQEGRPVLPRRNGEP
jgi:hypothetical protein